MLNGPTGKFVFMCSLLVAFACLCLEVLVAFFGHAVNVGDLHTAFIASLAFAAGAAGITPGTK